MQSNVYHRLYDRLASLIPDIACPVEGAAFYAPPRTQGDMALHCVIARVDWDRVEIEIAQYEWIDGRAEPAPWLALSVDNAQRTAELLVMQDQWKYEVVMSDRNAPNPRRVSMNVFAINCLTSMINLGGAFRPVDAYAARQG